ncbi:MAG: hypothetical protein NTW86_20820 [Candidatus Sumerlaeota bacterium]|nr:hypothetical protein [Candidatus Sumerlaeota bacterium]
MAGASGVRGGIRALWKSREASELAYKRIRRRADKCEGETDPKILLYARHVIVFASADPDLGSTQACRPPQ